MAQHIEIAGAEEIIFPTTILPLELYTEKRIAEFARDDKKIGNLLDQSGILVLCTAKLSKAPKLSAR